jgi:hypothetical protein
MGKRGRLIWSGWDGIMYLSFANWGARLSIIGMESLDSAERKRREAGRQWWWRWERQKDRVSKGGIGRRNNVWDNGMGCCGRRRQNGRDKDDDYNNDGVGSGYVQYDGGRDASEDLDFAEVISNVVAGNADGKRRVGKALMPNIEDLPDDL